ncbi:hypothetical protein [Aquimarina sp. 2201CG14-23]|uniref:hypothetical protein n=1 Tax=Aquimarina mycalae TaxID=3040073 RepID=UPI002478176F|nr:hypothetical protein [Aquimarina sp. 2201CG14-23]MDH7445230.1 hypothetical protein [Aquimarina sp. 2201CG14-23]
MKKIVLILILIWVGQHSYGQEIQHKNITNEANNAEKPTSKNTLEDSISNRGNDIFYSDAEWRKIKREIQRNKKRITNNKEGVHSTRVLDTIYLEIKISKTASQITDW